MELLELLNYNHKIKEIKITNQNYSSLYKSIIIKITLKTKDSEVIRFSKNENNNFLVHQKKDNDYFIRIPNNLNDTTVIYAHFFPKELYTYEETQQVFSEFDFSKLTDKEIEKEYYTMFIDKDNKLNIQSLFKNKEIKDPNYKNYYKTLIKKNISDMTEKGRFPLSSRYRPPYQYIYQPTIPESIYWNADTTTKPFWEAKIPSNKLSPLISDGVENTNEDIPINVYLNYQYLPTSTEYHQHYYGFEEKEQNENTYNILEGEKLNQINDYFQNENNYRIIQLGNIYDTSSSYYLNKENIINISLDNGDQNFIIEKNSCKNYYKIEEKNKTKYLVNINNSLKEGETYSFRYYIYIPDSTIISEDSCYIKINNKYSISEKFKKQDILLRDEWIYHEIIFEAEKENYFEIYGPQTNMNNNYIYLTNIQLIKMIEYSPLIKYNMRGIYLQEQNKSTKKLYSNNKIKETINPSYKNSYNQINNIDIPYGEIMINFDETNKPYYEQLTGDFYQLYLNNEEKFLYYIIDNNENYEKGDLRQLKNSSTNFIYNQITGDLKCTYEDNLYLTTQGKNQIKLFLTDNYKNIITEGEIYIEFYLSEKAINDEYTPPDITLPVKQIKNGEVIYNNINLNKLKLDNNSLIYLKIFYNNPCLKEKIFIKNAIIHKTEVNLNYLINELNNPQEYTIKNESELPIKISVNITDQINQEIIEGYCELSINDKLKQSTIINNNGECNFYLDLEDFNIEDQYIIKIEYFNKFYIPITFKYFILNILSLNLKPTIPIDIKNYNEENKNIYIEKNNILVLDFSINEKPKNDFIFNIYKNNILIKTFTNYESITTLFDTEINNNAKYDFVIEENEYYRKNKRSININLL